MLIRTSRSNDVSNRIGNAYYDVFASKFPDTLRFPTKTLTAEQISELPAVSATK